MQTLNSELQRQQIQKRLEDLTEKKQQKLVVPMTPAFEEVVAPVPLQDNSSSINALNRFKSGQQEPNSAASGITDVMVKMMPRTNGVTENTAVNSNSSFSQAMNLN